jgi:hypothetical protein
LPGSSDGEDGEYVSADDGEDYEGYEDGEEYEEEYEDGGGETDGRSEQSVPPSPQYGIRNLPPPRGRSVVVNSNGYGYNNTPPHSIHVQGKKEWQQPKPPIPPRSSTFPFPQEPTPLQSNMRRGGGKAQAQQFEGLTKGQSVTLRMAAVSLSNGGGGGGGGGGKVNAHRQPPASAGPPPGWQTKVSPAPAASTAQHQNRPVVQNANGNGNVKNARSRQPVPREREWEMINLDDLPPSSLGKSPGFAQSQGKGQGQRRVPVPLIRTDDLAHHPHQHHRQPQTPPALPPRRWTPSPTTTTNPKPTYAAPTNHKTRNHNQNVTRKAPLHAKVESPVPVGGQDKRPDIPTISFPNNGEDDTEELFGEGGPSIMISGPDDDDIGGGAGPMISVSGPDDGRAQPRSAAQSQGPFRHAHSQSHSQSHPHTQLESNRNAPRTAVKRRGGLVCGGCNGAIIGRIVSAMGVRWHPGCFRCTICNELLEHVSSYEHDGWPYCHLDYHEVIFFPHLTNLTGLGTNGII